MARPAESPLLKPARFATCNLCDGKRFVPGVPPDNFTVRKIRCPKCHGEGRVANLWTVDAR